MIARRAAWSCSASSWLTTEVPLGNLLWLLVWLVVAVAVHDGVLSPLVVGLGWLLRRLVPDRGRRYLQVRVDHGGLVTVIALPMIYRRGSQPPSKALLLQNFTANLGVLLGIIAALFLVGYAVRVASDRSAAPDPPSTR